MASQPSLIPITSGKLTAQLNPLGAELWSLCDAAGREYMTAADPAWWTGHAPLLFPIVGALKGGRYRIGHREYELPKHGFARTSTFEVVDWAPDMVRFQLGSSEAMIGAYPFAFVLEMEFRAEGDTLRQVATVTNPGLELMWFSFGFHPAFAWPLPGGAAKADHRIRFAQDEPQPIRRIVPASGLALPDRFPTPVSGNSFRPDAAQFEAGALIWGRLSSRSLTFGADGGSHLEIGFPDTPILAIWQKPGANYLCIEPWQGIADPEDWDGDFRTKPGVVELAAGASKSFRMDVRVVPG